MAFPGVRTNLVDRSFFPASLSRFRAALVGVCSKGPFNVLTDAPNIQEFVSIFGQPVAGSYLGDAVAYIGQNSNGSKILRVGAQYEEVTNTASGTEGEYTVETEDADLFNPGQYIRVEQTGKETTPNARVNTVGSGVLNLVSTGADAVALADDYAGATVSASDVANAANKAESFLDSPSWTTVTLAGTFEGDKNDYEGFVSGDETEIVAGDLLLIQQSGRAATREIRVKQVLANKKILFNVTNITEEGYQALPLQDNYTSATIEKLVSRNAERGIQLRASSEGTWANSSGSTAGLRVQVSPGSSPDTKKFRVLLNGVEVETIDNLSHDASSDDYYTTRINGNSAYLEVVEVLSDEPPTNTWKPWNTADYTTINVAEFAGGFNGENVSASDIIGTIIPGADTPTGLKVLEDPLITDVDFICVPGNSSIAVLQESARIGSIINALAIGDIPNGLNARQATDWQNGEGLYTANGRIDNFRVALFWNWWQAASVFTGARVTLPPSLGYLRCAARTFDQDKPWFAAAGVIRGRMPEALSVTYKSIQPAVRDAMYGNGNGVNPIIFDRNSILVWGNRTLQRTESKLTAINNVVLCNYILSNFSVIARTYVFDPIDDQLFSQLRLALGNFMESVKTERGVEAYSLVIDETNNPPATRNLRQVFADLAIIPIDAAEEITLNLTVEESGATLLQPQS